MSGEIPATTRQPAATAPGLSTAAADPAATGLSTAAAEAAATAPTALAARAAGADSATTPAGGSPGAQPSAPRTEFPPEPRLNLPAPQVTEAVAAAALVADRTRASILRMLADGPHCVCEIAAALDERQNNVSMHLARLREAGLVRAVRHSGDARWIFYERDEARCAAAVATLTELLR